MNDIEFSPSEITLSNLSEISLEQSVLTEQRLCELYELSQRAAETVIAMLSEDYGIYEALSFLSSKLFLNSAEPHNNCLEENSAKLEAYLGIKNAFDKAYFSDFLVESLSVRGKTLTEESFFEKVKSGQIFAFVKNPLASEAYDVFSEKFSEPRLKYAKDIKEAVSMLVSGDAGYCILPFEELNGVRLSAVSEALFKDDLKINSVTPVFGPLGNADMKYALVSKNITVPDIEDGDDRYLEIRLKWEDSALLTELIAAMSVFSAELYRINTVNFNTEDGVLPFITLVLKKESGSFAKFLTYLTLFISDYTSVGIYKNLE